MTVTSQNETIFHADAEHQKLRLVVMAALIILLLLSYFGVQSLLQTFLNESPLMLVCGLTLPIALGLGWVLEQLLKRYWHSGRYIKIEPDGFRAVNQVSTDMHLRWSANLSTMKWAFKLGEYPRGGRERRLPSSNYCLALQVQQGGNQVVVHTYLPPWRAQAIIENETANFVQLDPKDVYETSIRSRIYATPTRPDIPSKVLAGGNGRYWLAEKRRWQEGFELMPNDFEAFLKIVEEKSN